MILVDGGEFEVEVMQVVEFAQIFAAVQLSRAILILSEMKEDNERKCEELYRDVIIEIHAFLSNQKF